MSEETTGPVPPADAPAPQPAVEPGTDAGTPNQPDQPATRADVPAAAPDRAPASASATDPRDDEIARLKAQLAQQQQERQPGNPLAEAGSGPPRTYTVTQEDITSARDHSSAFDNIVKRIGDAFDGLKVNADDLFARNRQALDAEAQARGFTGSQYTYPERGEDGRVETRVAHHLFPGTSLVVE